MAVELQWDKCMLPFVSQALTGDIRAHCGKTGIEDFASPRLRAVRVETQVIIARDA